MTSEQEKLLMAPFSSDDVQWRLRNSTENGGFAVPYLDSRAVQNRFDDVLGRGNWQSSFCAVSTGNPKEPVVNVCTVSIYFAERGEWISKSDGAGWSDIEPVKGGLSDAFKRAASMWGCGRYMYQLDDVWVDIETKGKSKVIAEKSKPKLNDYYEKAVARIFCVKPQGTAPAKPEIQPQETPAVVSQEKQGSAPFYVIQSTSLSKGGNGVDSTALNLLKPDGKTVTAYIQGDPGLKRGQKLSHVKASEKEHPAVGKYYVIDEYRVAA